MIKCAASELRSVVKLNVRDFMLFLKRHIVNGAYGFGFLLASKGCRSGDHSYQHEKVGIESYKRKKQEKPTFL